MLAPALKGRIEVEVAVVTGVAAAVLVPLLPMQTGLLAAMLAGMSWGACRAERARRCRGGASVSQTRELLVRHRGACCGHLAHAQLADHAARRGRHSAWAERFLRYVPSPRSPRSSCPDRSTSRRTAEYAFAPARTVAAVVALLVALANAQRDGDARHRHGRAVGRDSRSPAPSARWVHTSQGVCAMFEPQIKTVESETVAFIEMARSVRADS